MRAHKLAGDDVVKGHAENAREGDGQDDLSMRARGALIVVVQRVEHCATLLPNGPNGTCTGTGLSHAATTAFDGMRWPWAVERSRGTC